MKLFEYQAKDLFEEVGIPVPKRKRIHEPQGVLGAVAEVGIPCVVKAQVLQGGRGKAGLIAVARSVEAAIDKTDTIFKSPFRVSSILIEEALHIKKEIYVAITADPQSGCAMLMTCAEGGVDIEEIARNTPDLIVKELIDTTEGMSAFQARNVLYQMGLDKSVINQGTDILLKLYELFGKHDCELAEINPLILTEEGSLIAADGKISIDDNALHRQPRFTVTRETFENDTQYAAALEGIPYLQFDGDIALMCAGAGLTNVVFDLIHYSGGTVASYLEFGGPNYRKAPTAMKILMEQPFKVLLIVTFGTIARADVMAQGLVEAIALLQPQFPIVTAIRGTGEKEAKEMLLRAGLTPLDDTEEAVRLAVELAGGGVR